MFYENLAPTIPLVLTNLPDQPRVDSENDCIIDAKGMNSDTQFQLLHHLQSYDEGTH
jgi:hypothetical protein